jgi:conjugative relaxase-like TrwC/TraI family protein
VSLLYAFGDGPVRAEVRAAHLEAVREAVNYMEAHCAEARVGTRWRDDDGWHTTTRNVDSDGFVAAAFDHFTSRANDPQLHTHVVVINRSTGSTPATAGAPLTPAATTCTPKPVAPSTKPCCGTS